MLSYKTLAVEQKCPVIYTPLNLGFEHDFGFMGREVFKYTFQIYNVACIDVILLLYVSTLYKIT